MIIGVPPVRVDVLTAIDGVEFDDAWRARVMSAFGGVPAPVLSRPDLMANKAASGRPQDLADIAALEAIARKRG